MYFFLWDGTSYQQLKVDGTYAYLANPFAATFGFNNAVYYDKYKKLLYTFGTYIGDGIKVYNVDEENFNLVSYATLTLPSISSNSGKECGYIFVADDNVFVSRYNRTDHYYFDTTAKTFTLIQQVYSNLTSSGFLLDATKDAENNLYIAIRSGSTNYVRKMKKDATGIYQFTGLNLTITGVKADTYSGGYSNGYYTNTTVSNPNLCMLAGCSALMYLTTSNELKYMFVDTATMTGSLLDVPFSDGLDLTQITSFKLAKTQFLYVISADTNLSTVDQARVYAYEMDKGYVFVGNTTDFFEGAAKPSALPAITPAQFTNNARTAYLNGSGYTKIIEVSQLKNEYTHKALNCNNTLIGTANAYAVALEDIPINSIGKTAMLLKA